MAKLSDVFAKTRAVLVQSESYCLDHYYQEPYDDSSGTESEDNDVQIQDDHFETQPMKNFRNLLVDDDKQLQMYSLCRYFLDGTRKTYKVGDLIQRGNKIYPLIAAQIRAGCVYRNVDKSVHLFRCERGTFWAAKNVLLLSSSFNNQDFDIIQENFNNRQAPIQIELGKYDYQRMRDQSPQNAGVAKANAIMHGLEVQIITDLVNAQILSTDSLLVVDGPLQFISEGARRDNFTDLFYNVIGVSKSFDPNHLVSPDNPSSQHIGAMLMRLRYGHRTNVFRKKSINGRTYGDWYLRIHPQKNLKNPLDGIIKIEKMATKDDQNGLDSDIVDNVSRSLLNERCPTCHGIDDRWPSHIYPVYLAETFLKNTFYGDSVFVNQFLRHDF